MQSLRLRCTSVNTNNHSGKPEDFRRNASFTPVVDAPENKAFFGDDPAEIGFSVSARTSDKVNQFVAGKEYVVSFSEATPVQAAAAAE